MKLTIVAATGGVGRHLLERAIIAGHDVTAVIGRPQALSRPVRVVAADLAAPDPRGAGVGGRRGRRRTGLRHHPGRQRAFTASQKE
jgi:uncharacterized protein YbjT (DUF2867 family)